MRNFGGGKMLVSAREFSIKGLVQCRFRAPRLSRGKPDRSTRIRAPQSHDSGSAIRSSNSFGTLTSSATCRAHASRPRSTSGSCVVDDRDQSARRPRAARRVRPAADLHPANRRGVSGARADPRGDVSPRLAEALSDDRRDGRHHRRRERDDDQRPRSRIRVCRNSRWATCSSSSTRRCSSACCSASS